MDKIIGIVQPTYMPWIPFFERMAISDIFVYLDDVEYSKNSFHNRNTIKSPNGRQLLTVPVLYKGYSNTFMKDILINNNYGWKRKHLNTIQQCYSKAEYYSEYIDVLEKLYANPAEKLFDIVMPIIYFLKKELRIETPCYLSSEIKVKGKQNEKLINLCKYFNGSHFIVKPGTEDYHPKMKFKPFGLDFYYLEYSQFKYPQLYGDFEPNLSALDYLLNCGSGNFIDRLNFFK